MKRIAFAAIIALISAWLPAPAAHAAVSACSGTDRTYNQVGSSTNASLCRDASLALTPQQFGAVCATPLWGSATAAYSGVATVTLNTAAPVVASGQIGYGGKTAAASNCGSLLGAAGCIIVNIGGATHYVPYY